MRDGCLRLCPEEIIYVKEEEEDGEGQRGSVKDCWNWSDRSMRD